jgi:uncharacterized protein (UPF0261 family)
MAEEQAQVTVALVGTLDTKGEEYAFVRDALRRQGVGTILIDTGVLEAPRAEADITRAEVADAAGTTVERLAAEGDRGAAIDAMARGAAEIAGRLLGEGRIHGIFGMGGSGGSTLVSSVMRTLPIGLPKLLVSTVASGDTRPYVGTSDIVMMPAIVDIAGINQLSERLLTNAAGAIAGMARAHAGFASQLERRPAIGASMFGLTTPALTEARERLEELGYEVYVFHATGSGGDAMEALIESGIITGVLDATTTEFADRLVGGVLAAGPRRLETAGERGYPQVVSLGALDMVNFGPMETVPERFRDRHFHRHNASITLMRTTPEENRQLGELIAGKLNRATGPVTVVIPLQGVSGIDAEGQAFHDPEADRALFDAIRAGLDEGISVVELDAHINDPGVGRAMADELHRLYQQGVASPKGA